MVYALLLCNFLLLSFISLQSSEHTSLDINAPDNDGNTELMRAIKKIQKNEGCKHIKSLLNNGAKTEVENKLGEYPIHMAMEWDTEHRLYPERKILPDIVMLLLQYKANPNVRYLFKNATPLHAAVFHNAPDVVKKLLNHGADKTLRDERGLTPLDLAKLYKFEKIITILSLDIIPNYYAPPACLDDLINSFCLVDNDIKIHQSFASIKIIDDYKGHCNNVY